MCSQFRPGAQDLATQRGGAGLGAVRVVVRPGWEAGGLGREQGEGEGWE